MVSVPQVTEAQLADVLQSHGFHKTAYETEISEIWIHKGKNRHLTVPKSCDGYYPSWLLDQLSLQARSIGDDSLVYAIDNLDGWKNIAGKKTTKRRPRVVKND